MLVTKSLAILPTSQNDFCFVVFASVPGEREADGCPGFRVERLKTKREALLPLSIFLHSTFVVVVVVFTRITVLKYCVSLFGAKSPQCV